MLITFFKNRFQTKGSEVDMTWSALVTRLQAIKRTNITLENYLAMSKDAQLNVKDSAGAMVCGCFTDNKRSAKNLISRSCLTLDLDNLDNIPKIELNCAYFVHSTYKHTPTNPRLRLIIPLLKAVGNEQYEAISRKIAQKIGIELFDQSTYEPSRLMFLPSAPSDAVVFTHDRPGDFLDPDDILAEYENWQDISSWPQSAQVKKELNAKRQDKQYDPRLKDGLIGAFCRSYTITDVLEKFIPGVYIEEPNNRYTYKDSTSHSGMIIYDNLFAFSHHNTDPCEGRLCNAFDLVRIHLFSSLDKDKGGADENKRSFKEMIKLLDTDKTTKLENARHVFKVLELDKEKADTNWPELLVFEKGHIADILENYVLILENHTDFKNKFRFNEFESKLELHGDLPWRKIESLPGVFRNSDINCMRVYFQKKFNILNRYDITDAIEYVYSKHTYHPLKDYLNSQKWDLKKRVDTLLINYLGAKDDEFTRMVTRKTLVAAVKRIFEPGCKKDEILTLQGPQGLGKTTLLQRLGGKWHTDSLDTLRGKECYERMRGVWLIEMGELNTFKKSDLDYFKLFVTKQEDTYRPSYGKFVETYKRQCIFFATTNDSEFLNDPTGNRRWWIVDVGVDKPIKNIWNQFNEYEVNQVWAEVMQYYKDNESILLDKNLLDVALSQQQKHSEESSLVGIIGQFLDIPITKDWENLSLSQRREVLANKSGDTRRDIVCAIEIWEECLGGNPKELSNKHTREFKNILRTFKTWTEGSEHRYINYGKQRIFTRGTD